MQIAVLSNAAEGKVWTTQGKKIELEYERNLELAELKAVGKRRDQGGGGARTYRAWLKSLGLVFMDDENRLQLTTAGAGLVQGEPPLEILTKQVLGYQFPSAFSYQRYSAVAPRFRVRPFIFLLQLLLDPRLGGYLIEKEDIAKIALCYGENNSQRCVDDVVERILEHREKATPAFQPSIFTNSSPRVVVKPPWTSCLIIWQTLQIRWLIGLDTRK